MKHNRFLSALKTPGFLAKDYLHRKPDPSHNWHFVGQERQAEAQRLTRELETEGIVLLLGYFQGEKLATLQQGFEAAVKGRNSPHDKQALLNLDFLVDHPELMPAALDDFLLEIMTGYYGKKFALARTSAVRFHPIDEVSDAAYLWHHDARGRQLHLMVLLNDVPPDGQRMSYLRRSHTRYYDHYRGLGEGSRFEKDVAADPTAPERTVELAGPAGTVGIFDANGLHTANRNNRARRDVLLFCYVSWRHFKPVRFRRADVEQLDQPKREVATFNPYCELVG